MVQSNNHAERLGSVVAGCDAALNTASEAVRIKLNDLIREWTGNSSVPGSVKRRLVDYGESRGLHFSVDEKRFLRNASEDVFWQLTEIRDKAHIPEKKQEPKRKLF